MTRYPLRSVYGTLMAVVLIFLFVGQALRLPAQGLLQADPPWVVFDGDLLRKDITVTNTGQDTAIYLLSFVNYRVTPEGAFEEVDEPGAGQHFAEPYLRFFPRYVGLAPGEAKVVYVQFRRGDAMADAEYRSHLLLGPLGGGTDSPAAMNIPVMIRQGELSAQGGMEQVALLVEDTAQPALGQVTPAGDVSPQPHLQLILTRSGNRSLLGDVTVHLERPGEEPMLAGTARGIAVFAPNRERKVTVPLVLTGVDDLNGAKLVARYAGEEGTLIAEGEVWVGSD